MYKSIFRILTIVEVISNLCFLALFSSMPAWNNGKALDSESEDPGSIPAKGEFFFFNFHFFVFLDLYIPWASYSKIKKCFVIGRLRRISGELELKKKI